MTSDIPRAHAVARPAGLALLLTAILATGCVPTSFLVTPVPTARALDEQVVRRDSLWAAHKVALVDADGLLINSRQDSLLGRGENPVAVFTEKLRKAEQDPWVKAVVLRVNSPGGTVTASDLMYTELRRFRERSGKPVVACMLDVAASGGYYIACAADRIYAHPTTVTGSIGVIMHLPEFTGTMAKLGVAVNVIKSGAMKDAGSMFDQLGAEERALFQDMIDQMYERFLAVAGAARQDIAPERLRELADGRVYLGPAAREAGLVDEIGTLHDAIAAAQHAAGLTKQPIKVVQYRRAYEYRPNIYARSDEVPAQLNLINVALPDLLSQPSPQFLYLWAPGW